MTTQLQATFLPILFWIGLPDFGLRLCILVSCCRLGLASLGGQQPRAPAARSGEHAGAAFRGRERRGIACPLLPGQERRGIACLLDCGGE